MLDWNKPLPTIVGETKPYWVIPRLMAGAIDIEPLIVLFSWVVSLNFTMVIMFLGFLSLALLLRTQPDMHKRLMLLASMSLMAPPLARIERWPVFDWIEEIPFVTITVLLLLAPLVIHDLVKDRRLHRATIAGGSIFVVGILAPIAISNTEFAQAFVRGMG